MPNFKSNILEAAWVKRPVANQSAKLALFEAATVRAYTMLGDDEERASNEDQARELIGRVHLHWEAQIVGAPDAPWMKAPEPPTSDASKQATRIEAARGRALVFLGKKESDVASWKGAIRTVGELHMAWEGKLPWPSGGSKKEPAAPARTHADLEKLASQWEQRANDAEARATAAESRATKAEARVGELESQLSGRFAALSDELAQTRSELETTKAKLATNERNHKLLQGLAGVRGLHPSEVPESVPEPSENLTYEQWEAKLKGKTGDEYRRVFAEFEAAALEGRIRKDSRP